MKSYHLKWSSHLPNMGQVGLISAETHRAFLQLIQIRYIPVAEPPYLLSTDLYEYT